MFEAPVHGLYYVIAAVTSTYTTGFQYHIMKNTYLQLCRASAAGQCCTIIPFSIGSSNIFFLCPRKGEEMQGGIRKMKITFSQNPKLNALRTYMVKASANKNAIDGFVNILNHVNRGSSNMHILLHVLI